MFEIDVNPKVVDIFRRGRSGEWKYAYRLESTVPFKPETIYRQVCVGVDDIVKAVTIRGNQLVSSNSLELLLHIKAHSLLSVQFSDCDDMVFFSENNPKFLPITSLQSQFLERNGIRKARVRHWHNENCPLLYDVKFNNGSTATIALYNEYC